MYRVCLNINTDVHLASVTLFVGYAPAPLPYISGVLYFCIYETGMLKVTVWNEMCISLICLCTESIRIVSCIGINLCL